MPAPTTAIRWTEPEADRKARVEVIRRAWHDAYAALFEAEEIEAIFNGEIEMRGTWTKRRSQSAGVLVADAAGEVVGIASLGILEPGVGEVAALYVLPERQGKGVGVQLWEASLSVFRHRAMHHVEVWTLAAAAARKFYEARGCELVGEGEFAVADHVLPAVGYAKALD